VSRSGKKRKKKGNNESEEGNGEVGLVGEQDGTMGWNNRENERVNGYGQGEEGKAGDDISSEVNKEDGLKCEGKGG
jgi:hypothetical protein